MAPSCSRALAAYRTLTSASSPYLPLHLHWRRCRGLEHQLDHPQRLGRASVGRPPGPLLWVHAVSVGEAMAAIPLIKHCMLMRPSLNILLTTSTVTSYFLLEQVLPAGVFCQFAPIDTPAAVETFLSHWHPEVGIFMESELWPNLITSASLKGVRLALLNARISRRSYNLWRLPVARHLIIDLLARFNLIVPLSNEEATRYQILGASPLIVHFAGNLKHAVDSANDHLEGSSNIHELKAYLMGRCVWIAASTHFGEEDVVASIYIKLKQSLPELMTIIAPRHPKRGPTIAVQLERQGLQVAMRSRGDKICSKTDVYIADTIGELKLLYQVSDVAFIGGSLCRGMKGHNFSEAASASCAILTGPYVGHFSKMVSEFQQVSRLAVLQVSGIEDLQSKLQVLFSDPGKRQACRNAARHASEVCAKGIIDKVWKLLEQFVLQEAFEQEISDDAIAPRRVARTA